MEGYGSFEDEPLCAICLDELDGDTMRLSCGHCFHRPCATECFRVQEQQAVGVHADGKAWAVNGLAGWETWPVRKKIFVSALLGFCPDRIPRIEYECPYCRTVVVPDGNTRASGWARFVVIFVAALDFSYLGFILSCDCLENGMTFSLVVVISMLALFCCTFFLVELSRVREPMGRC